MNPLAAFGGGAMPLALSSSTSSEGRQTGSAFNVGDFNSGLRLSKNAMYLIGGLAFLAAFVIVAKK